jgi:hypothetical protein
VLLAIAAVTFIAMNVQTGLEPGRDDRILNPSPAGTHVYDGVPRAHEPFLGVENWPRVMEALCGIVAVGFWGTFWRLSRRRGRVHPGIVIGIATTALMLVDPFINWAGFVVYDPRLLHLPIDWPYVSIAPNIEPLIGVVGYPFYFLIPGVLAAFLYRRVVSPRFPMGHFVNRHPLVASFVIGMGVAVPFDVAMELLMVRTELWVYAQAVPPVVRPGTWQWPVIVEPLLFSPSMAVTASLLVRDDSGRTVMERIANRYRWSRRRPVIGQALVAWSIIVVLYGGLYGGSFAALRLTGQMKELARPWAFEDVKVYDPQDTWKDAGEAGPFYDGGLAR